MQASLACALRAVTGLCRDTEAPDPQALPPDTPPHALLPVSARADGLGQAIAQVGSPHNLVDNIGVQEVGAGGWNATDEICRVCHVPHDHDRADHYADAGLLWNHVLSSATTSTLQRSACHDVHDQPGEAILGTHLLRVGNTASKGQASGLCLTCHIKQGRSLPSSAPARAPPARLLHPHAGLQVSRSGDGTAWTGPISRAAVHCASAPCSRVAGHGRCAFGTRSNAPRDGSRP